MSTNLKNAFNKVYYVGGLPFESVFALYAAVPGALRTFVVQEGLNFELTAETPVRVIEASGGRGLQARSPDALNGKAS